MGTVSNIVFFRGRKIDKAHDNKVSEFGSIVFFPTEFPPGESKEQGSASHRITPNPALSISPIPRIFAASDQLCLETRAVSSAHKKRRLEKKNAEAESHPLRADRGADTHGKRGVDRDEDSASRAAPADACRYDFLTPMAYFSFRPIHSGHGTQET